MELFILLCLSVLCAAFTGVVAESKGHNQGSWLLAGLFFGPLALIASLGLGDQKTQKLLNLLAEKQGVDFSQPPLRETTWRAIQDRTEER